MKLRTLRITAENTTELYLCWEKGTVFDTEHYYYFYFHIEYSSVEKMALFWADFTFQLYPRMFYARDLFYFLYLQSDSKIVLYQLVML